MIALDSNGLPNEGDLSRLEVSRGDDPDVRDLLFVVHNLVAMVGTFEREVAGRPAAKSDLEVTLGEDRETEDPEAERDRLRDLISCAARDGAGLARLEMTVRVKADGTLGIDTCMTHALGLEAEREILREVAPLMGRVLVSGIAALGRKKP